MIGDVTYLALIVSSAVPFLVKEWRSEKQKDHKFLIFKNYLFYLLLS